MLRHLCGNKHENPSRPLGCRLGGKSICLADVCQGVVLKTRKLDCGTFNQCTNERRDNESERITSSQKCDGKRRKFVENDERYGERQDGNK